MSADIVASSHTPNGAPGSGGRLLGRPILVATDGSAASNAAARVTGELARVHGASPSVVRAIEVAGAPHAGLLASAIAAADALGGPALHEPAHTAIRRDLHVLLGRTVDWPVILHAGTPAHIIVREAAQQRVAMIVMGIRRHGLFDRIVRDETTLTVVRTAPCVVFGVAPSLTTLPRRIVVGTDFGPSALDVARAALDVLHPEGTLILAHVTDADVRAVGDTVAGQGSSGLDASFDRTLAELAIPATVTAVRVVIPVAGTSPLAFGLLAIASEHQADAIAVGSRRQPWPERTFGESVSTDLARDGRFSLLVAPPSPQ